MKQQHAAASAVLVLIALAGVVAVVYGVVQWLAPSPGPVLKDSIEKANAGDYAAATRNLFPDYRRLYTGDPERMKKDWDAITKNRTVASVVIHGDGPVTDKGYGVSVTHRDGQPVGNKAVTFPRERVGVRDVDYTIVYLDGTSVRSKETAQLIDGVWQHGLTELLRKYHKEEEERIFASWDAPPVKDYTKVPKAGVALRLPEGVVPSKYRAGFEHPKYSIIIQFTLMLRGQTFKAFAGDVKKGWDRPGLYMQQRDDVTRDGIRYDTIEGDTKPINGIVGRKMTLVLGTDARAVSIDAIMPKQANFMASVRECLASAHLEGPDPIGAPP